MYSYKQNKKQSKKLLLAYIAAALFITGAVLSFYVLKSSKSNSKPSPVATTVEERIDLTPATDEEIKAADENKEQIVQREEAFKDSETKQPSKESPAKIVIVETTNSAVKLYVSGVFEENGTCTATAISGQKTYTKSSVGFQNATYTQCAPIRWDTALTPGTWSLTLNYKSDFSSASISKDIRVE